MPKTQDPGTSMRKFLRAASRLADVASRVVERHPKLAAITMVAKGVESMLDEFRPGPWEFFDRHQELYLGELQETIFGTLNTSLPHRVLSQENGDTALVFDLDGVDFGFIRGSGYLQGPHIDIDVSTERAWRALASALWECLGPRIRVSRGTNQMPVLLPDPLGDTLPSERARELLKELRAYRHKGYKRAVLLYGESGTGKSYMIRWVAGQLGGLTLRVHARDLARTNALLEILRMMRPTALLLDDICRLGDPAEIMDCFESIKASSELVLATANKLSGIDPAILRPGRFDDTLEIKELGPEVRAALMESLPEEIREDASALPMAYLNELHIRIDVLGPERGLQELKTLIDRRSRIGTQTQDTPDPTAEDKPAVEVEVVVPTPSDAEEE